MVESERRLAKLNRLGYFLANSSIVLDMSMGIDVLMYVEQKLERRDADWSL